MISHLLFFLAEREGFDFFSFSVKYQQLTALKPFISHKLYHKYTSLLFTGKIYNKNKTQSYYHSIIGSLC